MVLVATVVLVLVKVVGVGDADADDGRGVGVGVGVGGDVPGMCLGMPRARDVIVLVPCIVADLLVWPVS